MCEYTYIYICVSKCNFTSPRECRANSAQNKSVQTVLKHSPNSLATRFTI